MNTTEQLIRRIELLEKITINGLEMHLLSHDERITKLEQEAEEKALPEISVSEDCEVDHLIGDDTPRSIELSDPLTCNGCTEKANVIKMLKSQLYPSSSLIDKRNATINELRAECNEKADVIDGLYKDCAEKDAVIEMLTEHVEQCKLNIATRDEKIEELMAEIEGLRANTITKSYTEADEYFFGPMDSETIGDGFESPK